MTVLHEYTDAYLNEHAQRTDDYGTTCRLLLRLPAEARQDAWARAARETRHTDRHGETRITGDLNATLEAIVAAEAPAAVAAPLPGGVMTDAELVARGAAAAELADVVRAAQADAVRAVADGIHAAGGIGEVAHRSMLEVADRIASGDAPALAPEARPPAACEEKQP